MVFSTLILNILIFFPLFFFVLHSLQVLACMSPTLYAAHGHVKLYMHNDEDMVVNYTEVLVFSSAKGYIMKIRLAKDPAHMSKKLFHRYI